MLSNRYEEQLQKCVKEEVENGCRDCTKGLGIVTMPNGYALMLDPDGQYYYWLRHDGVCSSINWNRWAVYRWAKNDSKNNEEKD